MAVIGYMRVSTHHQKFDSQYQALLAYGVDTIYQEYESGRKIGRKELHRALKALKPGDTFVIFKLDRLARSTKQLLFLLEEFEKNDIQFVSIQNNIDTNTAMGKFFFTIMGAFAEMEAELIRERVISGLSAAKKKGVILGRPPLGNEIREAIELYHKTDIPAVKIAERCGVSTATIYRYLKKEGIYRTKKVVLPRSKELDDPLK